MIDIVIATYNPNQFLDEQIDSILSQSYEHKISRIIISDDNSISNDIIFRNMSKDNRIEYHLNKSGLSGPSANFSYGLAQTNARYIMTCDQDDVWLCDKIELSLTKMLAIDVDGLPKLIGTNSTLCNEKGISLKTDYLQKMNKNPAESLDPLSLLFKNAVPGCTMIFNRKLLDVSMPIPKEAIMHDWWLLSNALLYNGFYYINKSTMLYRQHESNCIGARKRSLLDIMFNGGVISATQRYRLLFDKIIVQVGLLDSSKSQSIDLSKAIIDSRKYKSMPFFSKLFFFMRYNKSEKLKKLMLMLSLVMYR
ncbi:UDP-Glc:alpha-D-GlcNAc-diphosphoundecaprenol beta-1,3-glucosyltransferase WfgD [compost metagenome]